MTTRAPSEILDLPMAERGLLALKRAVKRAIAEHARDGLPIYVWENGKVVEIPSDRLLDELTDLQGRLT